MNKVRSGVVMDVKRNRAVVMASNGEFLNIKLKGTKPAIGEICTGECITFMPDFKKAALAASLVLFLLTGTAAYAYSIPVATVTLSNPHVKVEVNRWNRIIKTTPLDDNAKTVLNSVNVNNKSLNDGLSIFVDQVKKSTNFVKDTKKSASQSNNGNTDKVIVNVENKKDDSDIDLKQFKEHAVKNKLDVEITKGKNDKATNKKNSPPPNSNKKSNKKNKSESIIPTASVENTDAVDKTNDSSKKENTDKNNSKNKDNNSNKNSSNNGKNKNK